MRVRVAALPERVFHLPGKHNQKTHGNRAGKKTNVPSKTSKHAPLSHDATPAEVEARVDEIYADNADAPITAPSEPLSPFEFNDRVENAASGNDAFEALTFSTANKARNHIESTGGEVIGLTHYKEGGFVEINNSLRLGMNPRSSDDQDAQLWERVANSMDDIANASQAEKDIVVYRGIRSPEVMFGSSWNNERDNTGLEWQDDAFTSTSVDPNIAGRFSGGFEGSVLMRILVPKGTPAFTPDSPGSTLSEEREIIIGRKSRYRVVRDELEWDDDEETMMHTLDVEVVR